MLESFAAFKFFYAFRIPIQESDELRFIIRNVVEKDGVIQSMNDAKLIDLSIKGVGFQTSQRLTIGDRLYISIKGKKTDIEVFGHVVRSFKTHSSKHMLNYGVELEEGSDLKKFLEYFIYNMDIERLRNCLIDITEHRGAEKKPSEGFEIFSLMLSLFKDMTRHGNKEEFIETILEEITHIVSAQRASLFLFNPTTRELEAIAALGIDKDILKFDYRKGIAGTVFTTQKSLNINTESDPSKFLEEIDRITGFKTRNILCYPIANRHNNPIGVIQVLNKIGSDLFNANDEKVLVFISLIFSSILHDYEPEKTYKKTPLDYHHKSLDMVGISEESELLKNYVYKLKDLDTNIYLEGEPGTGKYFATQVLHFLGKRGQNPFRSINCKQLSKQGLIDCLFGTAKAHSYLEECVGGTLYLNDISYLDKDIQNTLYTTLKERRIPNSKISLDTRIISSSTQNIYQMVENGDFHKELFDLLNTTYLPIPPLRKRRKDIPSFIQYFLKKACRDQRIQTKVIAPSIENKLMSYDWPLNIKELKIFIYNLVQINSKNQVISKISNALPPILDLSASITNIVEHIPYVSDHTINLKERLLFVERQLILKELDQAEGDRAKVCEKLGISKESLRKKLTFID